MLHPKTHKLDLSQDSIYLYILILEVMGIAIMSPFIIVHLIKGRLFLALCVIAIIGVVCVNAWGIYKHRKYYSNMILVALLPAVLLFLAISTYKLGVKGLVWCYPAVIWFYFMLPEKKAWLANAALLGISIPQALLLMESELAIRISATLILVSLFSSVFIRVITLQHNRLQRLLNIDPLTGVLNRVSMQAELEEAIEANKRSGINMSLLALDLDHFKKINDTFGHYAGDTVLSGISKLLKRRVRAVDKIFRIGGEEFLVLLYDTELDGGLNIADEFRETTSAYPFLDNYMVTLSGGVAELQPGESWKQWVKRADDNLYLAKLNGRNKIVT